MSQQLVVTAEQVAVPLGVALPLNETQRLVLEDAIGDAQADVEGYLNRPLFAKPAVIAGLAPVIGGALSDPDSWPRLAELDDEVSVLSWEAAPDGTFTLTVLIGLDGPNTSDIVRYVKAHAAESVRHNPSAGMGKRQVSSVSAEGQSVSYERAQTGEGAVGSAPTLKSLRRHRRLGLVKKGDGARPPWPYDGMPVGYQP